MITIYYLLRTSNARMTKLYLPDGAYNACMTTVVIAIVLFVFGASMGSFSSALLYRVHSGD